ncbi:hypothetical protein BH24DEI2_BH24DEI2_29190 [soil metagenome]
MDDTSDDMADDTADGTGNDTADEGERQAVARIKRQMKAEFRTFICRLYPQPLFQPPLSVDQVLAGIEALDASYQTLQPLARALLRHGTSQTIFQAALTRTPVSTALFSLGELDPQRFDPDNPTPPSVEPTRVREALAELAAVRLKLSHETGGDVLFRNLGWVWQARLSDSPADRDQVVALAFAEEVAALLVLAVQLENDQGLLPVWLMWDE